MWFVLPHTGCDLGPVMSLPQFPLLLMEAGGREISWKRCSGLRSPSLKGTLMMELAGLYWGSKAGLRQAGLGRGGGSCRGEGTRSLG